MFTENRNITIFNTSVGLDFLKEKYKYNPKIKEKRNEHRLCILRYLSEFQLHGAPVKKVRSRKYTIPLEFLDETNEFLAFRRYSGIIEKNMRVIELYLERYFDYLKSQNVESLSEITGKHIQGFLCQISGFSASTKDHTMRTVRQFMEYLFENGYHSNDLTCFAPMIPYVKRSKLPSSYTKSEIERLLESIDRSNSIGKRNYAILLIMIRLGIRCGDICALKTENFHWNSNKITFIQSKTKESLALPLLNDVGEAIIDYLKYGRPKCDFDHIFIQHRPPFIPCTSTMMYSMVSSAFSRSGIEIEHKKKGPHALRHSLASRLLEENIPLPIISSILGHATTETTATYLSIDKKNSDFVHWRWIYDYRNTYFNVWNF